MLRRQRTILGSLLRRLKPKPATEVAEEGGIFAVTEDNNPPRRQFADDLNAANIVAELPGTDKADEVVMLGGHFDSWQAGTGATDNAAGSAVMMEAMRILKQSGLKLRRTVRIALWGGEEQGLIGSREYVTAHFANATDMVLKPAPADYMLLLVMVAVVVAAAVVFLRPVFAPALPQRA